MPADYATDQAAELEPVFFALTEVQAACATARRRAEHRAAEIREHARAQAETIVSTARLDAEAERARAVSAALHEADEERSATLRDADLAAEGIRRRAAARMPQYVERAVAMVRSLAGDPP